MVFLGWDITLSGTVTKEDDIKVDVRDCCVLHGQGREMECQKVWFERKC